MLNCITCFCFQESTFVVLATIKHIVANDEWWYMACLCNKAVYPDSKIFFVKNVISML